MEEYDVTEFVVTNNDSSTIKITGIVNGSKQIPLPGSTKFEKNVPGTNGSKQIPDKVQKKPQKRPVEELTEEKRLFVAKRQKVMRRFNRQAIK